MADDFEGVLAAGLAPAERDPDRRFVERVQEQIALEERFKAQRTSLLRELATQLVALFAIGAGALWLGRSAPVANWAAESPATALAILLGMFMFVAATFITRLAPRNLLHSSSSTNSIA